MKNIQISSKNFWKKNEKMPQTYKKKINKKKKFKTVNSVYFFQFFFHKRFFIDFNETWNGVKFMIHYQCICKIQKNEIDTNINLLKTNWNQNLITRSPPAPLPESTPPPMSAEPAGAFHRDENEKKNQKKHFPFQKIQTWFFADHDIQMFDIISN